jgi:hypothetical protein
MSTSIPSGDTLYWWKLKLANTSYDQHAQILGDDAQLPQLCPRDSQVHLSVTITELWAVSYNITCSAHTLVVKLSLIFDLSHDSKLYCKFIWGN